MISNNSTEQLNRGLTNRHIQLMSIGGAIGTGLFMGAGKAIHISGPSIILIYSFTGLMLFFVMRAMGEILLSNLQYKSFFRFFFNPIRAIHRIFNRVDLLVMLGYNLYS